MNEILDACSLQVLRASWSTCHHKHGTVVEILECRDGIFSILVVRRANHHDVCSSSQGSIHTFFHCLEAQVVNHLVACSSEEVARELSTSLTHSQVTDGEHECHWLLLSSFCFQTECLELACHTLGVELRDGAFLVTVAMSTFLFHRTLAFTLLREVRELVRTEDEFLALASISVTLRVRCVHSFLNLAFESLCQETAFVLHSEEQLPCFLGDGIRQVLNIVRTTCHIHNLIEVSLFLQEQLLVASQALREVVWSLVRLVEWSHNHGIHICQSSRHSLRLRTEQVHVAVEKSLVIFRSHSTNMHLACAVA